MFLEYLLTYCVLDSILCTEDDHEWWTKQRWCPVPVEHPLYYVNLCKRMLKLCSSWSLGHSSYNYFVIPLSLVTELFCGLAKTGWCNMTVINGMTRSQWCVWKGKWMTGFQFSKCISGLIRLGFSFLRVWLSLMWSDGYQLTFWTPGHLI